MRVKYSVPAGYQQSFPKLWFYNKSLESFQCGEKFPQCFSTVHELVKSVKNGYASASFWYGRWGVFMGVHRTL